MESTNNFFQGSHHRLQALMQSFVLLKHISFELNVYYIFEIVNVNVLIQNALWIRDLGGWIDMLLLKQLDNCLVV